jgi:hypothetical protein
LAEGDLAVLDELQNALAHDYLDQMEIGSSISENIKMGVDEAYSFLSDMINDLNN